MIYLRMIPIPLQILLAKRIVVHQNYIFRYVRSIARYDEAPKAKLLKGKVKTVPEYEHSPRFESYKDFITDIRKSGLGTELEVEKQFLSEDYYGDAFDTLHKPDLREEKDMRSLIKKQIIGRKYFQLDKETTLLTHAAKEQIRHLHNLNPSEWNPKALSECFPISENGVKRLLRTKFVETCTEKIKHHDEEVAKRWEILKSGKFSDEIAPLTWKLYKEGKLVDDYFSGNPNLPTAPTPKKVIEIKKKEERGEFSNIIKSYIDYQKQKLLLESGKDNLPEKKLSLRDNNTNISKIKDLKRFKKYKYVADELDVENANPEIYPIPHRKIPDNVDDIPFSQFKEILREETSQKFKSKYKNEYDDFVMQETSKSKKTFTSEPVSEEDCFTTIPKYEKKSIEVMHERNRSTNNVYKYDEKLGYQYPTGKIIKGKIKVPPNVKKGKYVKVGQCVYDVDGKFLYKVHS